MRKSSFRVVTLRAPRKGLKLSVTAWLVLASAALLAVALWVLPTPAGGPGLAGGVDAQTWSSVLRQGMPLMDRSSNPTQTVAEQSWATSLFYHLTDVDPTHPTTILGWTVPGMAFTDYPIAVDGRTVDLRPPEDGAPSPGLFQHEQPTANSSSPSPNLSTSTSDPLVYVYHTHNRESFLPMLPGRTNFDDAYDKTKNITLIGTALVDDLKKLGIPAIHTTVDYWPMGDYSKMYVFSRKTVQEVLQKYPGLKLIIDMHRDSDPRNLTTATINGQTYAKIRIIIGGNNPNYMQNEKLAAALKGELDRLYPHLVRDIWAKRSTTYDATYNQDLSPNMILIEVGGPENTEAELDRTAQCLANGIAALLKDQGDLRLAQ